MTASNPTEHNKALVLAGIKGVFVDRDPTVLDRLFGDDYRQHNPLIANGTAAIKAVLENLPPDFNYHLDRCRAVGDQRIVLPIVVAEQAVENGRIAIDKDAFDACKNQRLVMLGWI